MMQRALANVSLKCAARHTVCAVASPPIAVQTMRSAAAAAACQTYRSASASTPSVLVRSFASKSFAKKPTKLVGADLDRQVATLSGWSKTDKELSKDRKEMLAKNYTFEDFNTAFAVMTRVALLAEKMNHHPTWSNVYNRLEVKLETHDVSGISDWVSFGYAHAEKPFGSSHELTDRCLVLSFSLGHLHGSAH